MNAPLAVAAAWLLAGVASSAIALVQYAGFSAHFSPWINYTDVGYAFANLRQRNHFASLTNIALASLLWWEWRPNLPLWRKAMPTISSLVAMVLALGNASSSSRTGLFQFIMVAGLAIMWGRLRRPAIRRVWILYMATYVAGLWAIPLAAGLDPWSTGAWARLEAGDAICSSRLTLWHNVLTLIAQHPWRGWGWGELDYAHYITLYDGPRFCDILDNAHNLPLHLAVECGIPVAVAVCGLILIWIVRQRPWAETDPTRQLAWSVLAVIGLHSMLEYPLWYGPFQMAVGLCALMLRRPKPATELEEKRPRTQAKYALTALVLLAGCAYAAWDYHRISQVYLAPDQRDPAYQVNTLQKVKASWLFRDQVKFAELSLTPLTPANAAWQHEMALELLHFSPERRVVERVIDSALMLGLRDEVNFHLQRLKAAFPDAYNEWVSAHIPAG